MPLHGTLPRSWPELQECMRHGHPVGTPPSSFASASAYRGAGSIAHTLLASECSLMQFEAENTVSDTDCSSGILHHQVNLLNVIHDDVDIRWEPAAAATAGGMRVADASRSAFRLNVEGVIVAVGVCGYQ